LAPQGYGTGRERRDVVKDIYPYISCMDYKKNNVGTDRENGRGNKRESARRITESKARQKESLFYD
jgi:hypothetical protein